MSFYSEFSLFLLASEASLPSGFNAGILYVTALSGTAHTVMFDVVLNMRKTREILNC